MLAPKFLRPRGRRASQWRTGRCPVSGRPIPYAHREAEFRRRNRCRARTGSARPPRPMACLRKCDSGGVPGVLGRAGVARTMIVVGTERTRKAIPITPMGGLSPNVLPNNINGGNSSSRRDSREVARWATTEGASRRGRRFAPNGSRFAAGKPLCGGTAGAKLRTAPLNLACRHQPPNDPQCREPPFSELGPLAAPGQFQPSDRSGNCRASDRFQEVQPP